jgi:hypothetical protein
VLAQLIVEFIYIGGVLNTVCDLEVKIYATDR